MGTLPVGLVHSYRSVIHEEVENRHVFSSQRLLQIAHEKSGGV